MRPIDADALMESIGCADAVKYGNRDMAQQDTSYSTMMLYEIKDEIDAQPTVGGWISVKDRLPEKNGRYLVYENGVVYSAEYEKNRPDSEWTDDYEGYLDMMVSHWMPLPEPPEEEA